MKTLIKMRQDAVTQPKPLIDAVNHALSKCINSILAIAKNTDSIISVSFARELVKKNILVTEFLGKHIQGLERMGRDTTKPKNDLESLKVFAKFLEKYINKNK